jgi:hypothetical protein
MFLNYIKRYIKDNYKGILIIRTRSLYYVLRDLKFN